MFRLPPLGLVIAILGFFCAPAQAATSTFAIFPDRIFANGGVTNAANLFGNTPAEATFNAGGIALFDFGEDITGNTFMFDVTGVTGPSQVSIRFLDITGFTVIDTAPGFFPVASPLDFVINIAGPGTFTLPSAVFTSACTGIGGCNSVLLNVTGAGSFTANVVSSAPEPSVWALMIIGFAGLAWRMKAARRRGSLPWATQLA
ncbi:MAG: hypothetical protein AAGJ73_05910 [Pseudomonadota bacterium]